MYTELDKLWCAVAELTYFLSTAVIQNYSHMPTKKFHTFPPAIIAPLTAVTNKHYIILESIKQ